MTHLSDRIGGRWTFAVAAALFVLLLGGCGSSGGEGAEGEADATTSTTSIESTTTSTAAPTTTTTAAPAPIYTFPLQPPEAVDYGPGHSGYPATDIFCEPGTSFVAVTGGTVYDLSTTDQWDPAVDDPSTRSGIFVSILGDDGVRYHGSHLSSIAPGIELGARVESGQQLGTTGTTGNAADRPPHLHFGVSRPTSPGDWEVRRGEVDPYPLLQAWERGEQVTPVLPPG